ncbi:DUF4231 domain-containing protein [Erythrobacter sp. CCH5-A1]|jgi:hypothetical protein|uniref:DUF4231 domain-containing protein n=1 Tax=Erythrobacter sp. CCH5-A1 TaxID=1768792 RepID=UPI00082B2B93|nr:DUF4231 domain-containing protein [Erythrobacter sp. CCH5-A1]
MFVSMPATSLPDPVRASWQPHLALGITGHRATNPAYSAHAAAIATALEALFDRIDAICASLPGTRGQVRLHSLLVDGTDQVAGELALARGWDLAVPLPFGPALNGAINAHPETLADVDALLGGRPAADPAVEAKAAAIRAITARARLFALADRDAEIEALWRAHLAAPEDRAAARAFEALASDNVALAGRVMIEHTDLVIAVWDGKVPNLPGGTGHTVAEALKLGAPVLLIDPARPDTWRILSRPEELGLSAPADAAPDQDRLEAIIRAAVVVEGWSPDLLARERWRPRSSRAFGLYRRIERVFGGGGGWFGSLKATYEAPDAIAAGSGAGMIAAARAMPGADPAVTRQLAEDVMPMFAWADGVANRLADAYRSGMCVNFVLATLAVMVGILFLPSGMADYKWVFALVELLLLGGILAMTAAGSRFGWHRRWFATRRVAEYLRHAPALLLLGVVRPTGRWPRGGGAARWPEHFSRHALRAVGLPQVAVTRGYLRSGLAGAVLPHVTGQRTYHIAKAHKLETVHHRLDKAAETCFALAVASVLAYLVLKGAGVAGWVPKHLASDLSPFFTFAGVAFPTLGANLSGIRYFGDFERFGAISRVAAEKLGAIEERIGLLLSGADSRITYAAVADLIHTLDEAVVEEIASWQAVFGAKHLALPA